MIIKPFGNNILVKPIEKKQVLVGDLQPLCEYGEVIAVGDDVRDVSVGNKVAFTKWGIREVEIEGEMHRFLPEDPHFLLGTIYE